MQELLFQDIINEIENIPMFKDIDDFSIFYKNLPPQKAALYLSSLQNLSTAMCLIESYNLEKKEIEKGALMFLAALNILLAENSEIDEFQSIVDALKHIYALDNEVLRRKIILGFFCISLNLFKNFSHEPAIISEKIIIGEFHDMGGFQSDTWGVSVDFGTFSELLKNITILSPEKTQKLKSHYHHKTFEELPMISSFSI